MRNCWWTKNRSGSPLWLKDEGNTDFLITLRKKLYLMWIHFVMANQLNQVSIRLDYYSTGFWTSKIYVTEEWPSQSFDTQSINVCRIDFYLLGLVFSWGLLRIRKYKVPPAFSFHTLILTDSKWKLTKHFKRTKKRKKKKQVCGQRHSNLIWMAKKSDDLQDRMVFVQSVSEHDFVYYWLTVLKVHYMSHW